MAALQAEVVALRATVRALRAELDAVWESAAAATAEAPALAVTSMVLDLRPDIATTEIVLADVTTDQPEIVMADVTTDQPEIVLADLPEFALLDPKQARDVDVIDVSEPATASAADKILPARRTA